jgi:hypothetical protein
VNFDHLVIRRIRTLNVQTAASATAQQFNIWIVIEVTNNTTQYTYTNILVEQCEFHGGCYGVGLYATHQSGFNVDPNINMDNIVVRDIWHDTGINPTGTDTFANVHIGSRAQGGRCWVSNITGKNSWDVGVEIDNFNQAFVTNIYLENWYGNGIAITNFNAPADLNSQVYHLVNIAGRRDAGGWSTNSTSLIGMVQSNNVGGTPQTFGRVIAENVKYYRKNSNLDNGSIAGDLAALKLPMIEFQLTNATYYAEGLQHTAGSVFPRVIYTTPSSSTRVSLRNIDIRMSGTFGVGSIEIDTCAVYLSGIITFLVDNINVNMNFTNVASLSERGMEIGQAGSTTASGTVRNFRVTTNGTSSRGIIVHNTTKLTVPSNTQIRIEDCDFSGMTSGTEILYTDTVNQAKTWVYGIKWRTFPKAPYIITAPVSATGTQYIDTWPGTMLIEGGTVTLVEISRDNATYYQVSTSSGVAIPIQHTDYYRITYSVAPTITLLPQI